MIYVAVSGVLLVLTVRALFSLSYLEIAGIVLALIVLAGIYRTFTPHGLGALLWRWMSGHPLDGIARTNATWFKPANKVLDPSGRVHRWHHLPRVKRAGIRSGTTLTLGCVTCGLIFARTVTLLVVVSAGSVTLATAAVIAVRFLRQWHCDRIIAYPLAAALAPLIETPIMQARKAISLPPSFLTTSSGEIGTIALPDAFRAAPEQRKAVEHLVSSRLPVDVEYAWHTTRKPLSLGILASPKPPDMVNFLDYVSQMEACQRGQVLIGLDRHKTLFHGSFNTDDPHWGFSVGSGRGKSTFLQCTAAQILHNDPGATLDGIDPKMSSLDPLIGIPGVGIACDPRNVQEMWDRITEFKTVMFDRLDALKADPTIEFPIKLLVIDEVNTCASMWAAYWKSIKSKTDPATAPAWSDIAWICWMGRAARCHVIIVGQRLDDKATGGIGLRDSLGFRGLAGYRANQWMMLIGSPPVPRSQKPKGRWIYSDGQAETWVQNVYAKPEVIRDYAMAGRTKQPAEKGRINV